MRNTSLFLFAAVTAIAFTACKKDDPETSSPSAPKSTAEIKAPRTFNFSTAKNLNLSLQVNSSVPGVHRVEIYDLWPYEQAARSVYSGLTNASGSLQRTVQIPSFLEEVYIVVKTPNGSSTVTRQPLSGNNLSVTLGKTGGNFNKVTTFSPDCSSGCDNTLNSPNYNLYISDGQTTCLTGSFSGGIMVDDGSTLRICGTAAIQWGSIDDDDSRIEIASGAVVTFNNFNFNDSDVEFENWSDNLSFSSNLSYKGLITNHGTMHVGSDMNIQSHGKLVNNGTLNVGNNMNLDFSSNKYVKNYGTITVGNNFQKNGTGDFENYCKLTVGNELILNKRNSFNYSYMHAGSMFRVNSDGSYDMLELHDGAMVSCASTTINSDIVGYGTTSTIKVTGNTTINGSGDIDGNVELCDQDGVETLWGDVNAPATISCNNYIPTDGCNTEGFGTPAIADADGDGVADELDDYPNDATRALNVYYPSENEYGTLVYEDLWPYLGDFDFNDLVIDYRYQLVQNASGDVVNMNAEFALRAIGAGKHNGFAFVLDNAPGDISSVTGTNNSDAFFNLGANGTESGQSKAVIPVFSDAFNIIPNLGTQYVNTLPEEATYPTDTVSIAVVFSSPVSEASLGTWPYNPFLMDNANRGKEVHLVDQLPTDLMNTSLLGSGDDDSNPGSNRYFKNANNLPWALNIVGGFRYPIEKIDVLDGYPYFAPWALSGGNTNADWYEDKPGYRNTQNLY